MEKRIDQVTEAAKSTNKLKDPKVNKHIGRIQIREQIEMAKRRVEEKRAEVLARRKAL